MLVASRPEDPPEKIGFVDDHFVRVKGGQAVAEATDEAIYLAIALRNVGTGLAVLDRWDFHPTRALGETPHREPDGFRRLTRDIYVPAGDIGFWQGAFRDREDDVFVAARDAIVSRQAVTVDLLYGDHEGGQRTITRFALIPAGDDAWLATPSRHWNLDRSDPR